MAQSSCNLFFPDRGFFHVYGKKTPGLYQLEGLSSAYVLLGSVPLSETDIIIRRQTINGSRILYVLGKAFGETIVQGELLLGAVSDKASSERLGLLLDWFNTYRVSNFKNSLGLSIGKRGYRFFVHQLVLGNVNVEFNTQPFAIRGSIAEPRKSS
jgi:hypothetical protein